MPTLRIVTAHSGGLLNDATIYQNIFKYYGFDVILLTYTYGKRPHQVQKFATVNLFLENIQWDRLKQTFPSKINLFMPNYELFYDFKQLVHIDYVLCKTKISLEMFTHLQTEHSYSYQCIYTKFTTYIPFGLRVPYKKPIVKNSNLFVHLAGKSPMKGTTDLVYCWIQNKGFLDIDPEIKLVITCYQKCHTRMLEYLKTRFQFTFEWEPDQTSSIFTYLNLTLHTVPVPDTEYVRLLTQANVAVCPSEREGYGHYINEARYFGTFVLTIDYPPMNELITDQQNGILVHKYKSEPRDLPETTFVTHKVYPDQTALKEGLIYCIRNKNSFSSNQLAYRKRYFTDMKYFDQTMGNLVKSLKN